MKIIKNIFTLYCILCFPKLIAQTNNILKNGDFETSEVKPWSSGVEQIEISSDNVHSGSYALEIKKGGQKISQTITVKPNSKYRICGYLKTSSGAETLELVW